MYQFLTITWDMSRGLDLGFITLRYYSLLFAAGFVLGYLLMKRIFRREGVPLEKLDTLLTYVVVATIVGARLGHVFFYEWDYYSQNPAEIFKVWKGGLASHGAAVAIIIAIILYSKRVLHKPNLWMLDRLVLTVALAAALIRVGNWFNSEIYGEVANSGMETVYLNPPRERIMEAFPFIEHIAFRETAGEEVTDSIVFPLYEMEIRLSEEVPLEQAESLVRQRMATYINSLDKESQNILFPDNFRLEWDLNKSATMQVEVMGVPRHPTQLYEAFAYLLIFLTLYRLYLMRNLRQRQGFIFGMFLILVFGFRFFIEYLKEVQVSAEVGQVLNTGQKLSIPMVLIGLFFVVMAKRNNDE